MWVFEIRIDSKEILQRSVGIVSTHTHTECNINFKRSQYRYFHNWCSLCRLLLNKRNNTIRKLLKTGVRCHISLCVCMVLTAVCNWHYIHLREYFKFSFSPRFFGIHSFFISNLNTLFLVFAFYQSTSYHIAPALAGPKNMLNHVYIWIRHKLN